MTQAPPAAPMTGGLTEPPLAAAAGGGRWWWPACLPLLLLAGLPSARFLLFAANQDAGWLERITPFLALLMALAVGRGDATRRWLMPGILSLAGWPWVLLFAAVARLPLWWAGEVVAAAEWLPRRALRLLRCPPAPAQPWAGPTRTAVLWGLLLAALAANAAVFLNSREAAIIGIDGQWYLQASESLLARGTFEAKHPLVTDGRPAPSRATRMPGYPLFLAGARLAAGRHQVRLAAALQSLANAAAVLLLVAIGQAVGGPAAGVVAGILFLLYPPLHLGAPRLLTESPAVPLHLLTIYLLLRAYRTGAGRWWAAAGAMAAVVTLIRPNAFLSPFLVALTVAWWARREGRGWRALRGPAVMLGAFLLLMAPWWVRNALLFHRFVPLTTLGGFHAWGGNDPRTFGLHTDHHYREATRVLRQCGGNEVAADREMARWAREALRANLRRPPALARLCRAKLERLVLEPESESLNRWVVLLHRFVLAAALVGALFLWRSARSAILVAFAAPILLVHLATYGMEARYLLPLLPLALVWAGTALAWLGGAGGAPEPAPSRKG
ncbi:MAG: hypothetical protein GX774_01150 [Armatimonadetes bacterium]|nr:hypothetical protein [Armatimonadota bacterium]